MKKITLTTTREQYSDKCKICKKKISGFSESQVNWNMELHINQKHKKGEKNEK